MERRAFTRLLASASVLAVAGNVSVANAFKMPSVPGLGSSGGGGGASWKDIAETFNDGLKSMAMAALDADGALTSIGAALGLKREEALAATTIEQLKEGKPNGDALADVAAKSKEYSKKVLEELKRKDALDAKQKKEIAVATGQYFKAFVKASGGIVKIADAKNKASGAGSPGMADGLGAAQAAKDIPVLAPKAISFFSASVEVVGALSSYMNENDIAVPEAAEAKKAMSVKF